MAYVVLLKDEKLISVCEEWIENPVDNQNSLDFFSRNEDVPDLK